MWWRCEFCGAEALRAKTQRHCPHCGAPQNPANRYFPPESAQTALTEHVYHGPDRLCGACGVANTGNARFCERCGAPLDEARTVVLHRDEANQPNDPPKTSTPPRATSRRGLIVVSMVLGAIALAYFWRDEVSVELIAKPWRHEIKVEQFLIVEETAWCRALPRDARVTHRRREVEHWIDVPDGETCQNQRVDLGDGTFTTRQHCQPRYRREPVYADRCTYTVQRWRSVPSLIAEGQDGDPQDPRIDFTPGTCLGCKRIAGQSQSYAWLLRAEATSRRFECPASNPEWSRRPLHSRGQLAVGVLSRRAHCASLRWETP